MRTIHSAVACVAVLAATLGQAQAAFITTSGTLPNSPAGAYDLFNFEVTSPGITTFFLDGDTDAWLGVFSGTNMLDNSTYIAEDDDSGSNLDSFMSLSLGTGSYTAWITTHGSFWDPSTNSIVTGHDHTPMDYTLTITGNVADASAVPEPATLALMGLGGIGLVGGAARKRRKMTLAA